MLSLNVTYFLLFRIILWKYSSFGQNLKKVKKKKPILLKRSLIDKITLTTLIIHHSIMKTLVCWENVATVTSQHRTEHTVGRFVRFPAYGANASHRECASVIRITRESTATSVNWNVVGIQTTIMTLLYSWLNWNNLLFDLRVSSWKIWSWLFTELSLSERGLRSTRRYRYEWK